MRTNDEILALARQLQEAADELTEAELQNIQKSLKEELYLGAKKFLNEVEQLYVKVVDLEVLFKRQKALRHSLGKESYQQSEEYIQLKNQVNYLLAQTNLAQEYYRIHFDFQTIVNAVLGQQIQMVYVFDDGSGPELYDLSGHDLLTFEASSSAKLNARYPSTAQGMQQLDLMRQNNSKWNFSLSGLKDTYKEVIRRYRYSKSKLKGGSFGKTAKVMWNLNDKWEFMRVSSEGDINEAYAMFVLVNNEKPSFKNGQEQNVHDYAMEGIQHVDNVSGFLQGDVSVNGIEYGIKSAGASVLGLKQIKDLAFAIVNKHGEFSVQDLQNVKQTLKAKGYERNRIEEYVSSQYDKILEIMNFDTMINIQYNIY